MSKIPLPERGQPIDVDYLYQLVNAINSLSNQVSSATYKTTTIDTRTSGPVSVRTGDAKIVGGYKDIPSGQRSVGIPYPWSYSLGQDFKYPPIVTATPVNRGTGTTPNVNCVLTSVTTQLVEGVLLFNTGGNVNVTLNILAIGIPK